MGWAEALGSLSGLSCVIQLLCFQEKEESSGTMKGQVGVSPGPFFPPVEFLLGDTIPSYLFSAQICKGSVVCKKSLRGGQKWVDWPILVTVFSLSLAITSFWKPSMSP